MNSESKPDYRILVCVPAFNEAKTIVEIINNSKKYANGVIVYDDGSTDDTYDLAVRAAARVIRSPQNTGYGTAIRALFQAAREQDADIMITLIQMVSTIQITCLVLLNHSVLKISIW